jgi:hypothetical protein
MKKCLEQACIKAGLLQQTSTCLDRKLKNALLIRFGFKQATGSVVGRLMVYRLCSEAFKC